MTESIWFTDALMKIHITPEETGGEYALIEGLVPPGHMPPPHVHHVDAESFFVLEGEIVVYTTAGEQVLLPGQAAHVPAGEPHTFRVTSSGPARLLSVSAPAGLAGFFRAAGEPAQRDALPVLNGPPDVARVAKAAAEHNSSIVGPPGAVPADLVAEARS
jgi:quercetin dioxygenase-like cupin family protein